MPKVSIITPCHNAEAFIGQLIESVRAQTLADWEHVIVDDGSTDGSRAVVERYLKLEPRLRLIEQPNRGVCNARNRGFGECSADSPYVYFLDADDVIEPGMLAVMVEYLERRPEAGLAYCDYISIDEHNRRIEEPTWPRCVPTRFGLRELPYSEPKTPLVSIFAGAPVMESLSVLRRSVFQRTRRWDETLGQHGEGIDLFLQFALLSEVHFVPEKLYRYRRHPVQSSADPLKRHQRAKLVAKWRGMEGLTKEQRRIVRSAIRFSQGRLLAWRAFNGAATFWKRRRFMRAGRAYLSTAFRYIAYFDFHRV